MSTSSCLGFGTKAPSLDRNYPASTVLRASPPPPSARPVPRGSPVGGHIPPPRGFPVLRWISVCRHAASSTPAGPLVRIIHGTAYSTRFPVPSDDGLPQDIDGSAPTTKISGPLRKFTCVAACLLAGSPSDPLHRRLRRLRYLHRRSDYYRRNDQVAGRESHPLKIQAFPRRTISDFLLDQRPAATTDGPRSHSDLCQPKSRGESTW